MKKYSDSMRKDDNTGMPRDNTDVGVMKRKYLGGPTFERMDHYVNMTKDK